MANKFFPVPAGYFGMALGLAALGLAWRLGGAAGLVPPLFGEGIAFVALVLWFLLVGSYAGKWLYAREQAVAELTNVVQCCFISLIPITTMLMGLILLPYAKLLAWVLLVLGIVGQLAFGAYRAAGLWRGTHSTEATTPILYLPGVAGNFVAGAALGAVGLVEMGLLFLGAGVLSWLSIESALLHRLRTGSPLPPPMRAVMGIQLAPPFVGAATYLGLNGGTPDMFAYGLLGYGIVQAIFLLRLMPWVAEAGFSPSFWAYSFGLGSMVTCGFRLLMHNSLPILGMSFVVVGTAGIALLVLFTIRFFVRT